MLINGQNGEMGFTLMELLAVLGVMGILTATSLESFQIVKMYAYDSQADVALRNIATAMEQAESDREELNDNTRYTVIEKGPGKLSSPYDQIFPGVMMQNDIVYMFDYNPTGSGFVMSLAVYHCKSHIAAYRARDASNVETNLRWRTEAFLSVYC